MNAIWMFLNGKKTVIGAVAGLALSWAEARGWVSGDNATYLASLVTLITGIGIAHKVVKAVDA